MSNQIIAEASIDVNEAPRQAENAQKTADKANNLAKTTDGNIKNINDPNYLSPFEKPQLEIQMNNFATIYAADKDIAKAEGIDFTAYDAAYQAYLDYMTPLVADMTKYSPIVRSTFNSMVTAVQAEQKRFNTATQAQYTQQINKAKTDISDGQSKYQALQSEAETMKSSVAGISDAADRAISSAGFASNAASTASQAASSALASAMSAQNDASSAVTKAESTALEFGKVSKNVNSAVASAASAESNASSAVAQASSAATDSKDAKQIAGAVSQNYKILTDGSTMTIAELQNGLAAKLTKKDLDGYATETWAQNQIKTTADGINGTLSSVKSTIDSQTTSINDLKADSHGFKEQFTTVTDAVGKHTTDIGTLQASSKELSSNFDSLSTANGKNEHDISQLKLDAKGFSSTLENVKTQVQDSSVGVNLLRNTKDYSDWDISGDKNNVDSTIVRDYALTNLIQITGLDNTGKLSDSMSGGGPVYFVTGQSYTFSVYAKAYTKSGNGLGIHLGLYGDYTDQMRNGSRIFITDYMSGGWIKYSATFEALGSGPFGGWKILASSTESVDDLISIYFWGFKLEKGTVATDWCPNPADNATVTAVSHLSRTVDDIKADMSKKIEGKDLNGYATETWAQNKIKVTADGINGNLSSVKSTVDKHTTSINDFQADSEKFKAQFTKVSGTLNKQNTDISTLQASSKELSSNFSSLSTANGKNEHNIGELQQTSKEFNSTLTTVKTQVVNSAVGTNLLVGTSNAQDYTVSGSGWALGSQSSNGSSCSIPATPGKSYTYSAIVKSTTYDCYPELQFFDSGKNFITNSASIHGKDIGIRKTTAVAPENAAFMIAHMVLNNPTDSQTMVFNSEKLEKGNLATDWCPNPADNATVTALTKVKQTADSVKVLANDNHGDIAKLQVTAKGLQSTVKDKVSSSQLTQLSGQLTNEIKKLSSSTSSKFTQTSKDINAMVKKGDVVNQFNLDAGGALLSTTGNSTKIVFSSPNIIFDSANPVQIPNANIPGTLTGKTFEAGTITATTKIKGADIEAPLIHSPSGSFKLVGNTGDIIGPSIHAADNSWGISSAGKIHGTSITASVMDISGDGSGPNFDAKNVTPDTTTGIYSRYKYTNPNVGFDVNGMDRKMYKNGYLVINGDTFLNRTIGDWSADGGGKYVYDTMYEANVIKMRAYNYTGSNVQTDDPSSTEGSISSRLDIQPSAITMGCDWSVGNPNILIDNIGRIKGGLIATNANHSIGTTDGGDLYFMRMNKNATNVDGSSISIHVKKLYQSSLLSLKTDIKPIDPHEALTEVVKNDVMGYHFKNGKTTDPKSVSVILDDINPIPKYYTSDIFKSADGTGRNDGNIVGYLMLSIKDLNSRLQKLEGAN